MSLTIEKLASEIRRDMDVPEAIHSPLQPTDYGVYEVSISTEIGGRKYQEDRCTFCPQLIENRADCAFFGIFDGTVGDFASDNVKDLVIPHLVGCRSWQQLLDVISAPNVITDDGYTSQEVITAQMPNLLMQAIHSMYRNADAELIRYCAQQGKDYASSTSVTVMMVAGYIGVGHLGDSRVALGCDRNGILTAEFLTYDHKPDQPHEKHRIMQNGGSVEYLHNHNNKPFIRGGDFTARKQRGEQPMQLQYSRAFGGKDLKMYGLSNEPDVKVLVIEPYHRCLVLASDGLWDVQPADTAVKLAMQARREGKNPAEYLVQTTLNEQRSRNQSADNITAIVIFFN